MNRCSGPARLDARSNTTRSPTSTASSTRISSASTGSSAHAARRTSEARSVASRFPASLRNRRWNLSLPLTPANRLYGHATRRRRNFSSDGSSHARCAPPNSISISFAALSSASQYAMYFSITSPRLGA
eukprot:scaffold7909_cov36-Tisochrysis_lutea.AAC.3